MTWSMVVDLIALLIGCGAAFVLGVVVERRKALLSQPDRLDAIAEIDALRAVLTAQIGYCYRLEQVAHWLDDAVAGTHGAVLRVALADVDLRGSWVLETRPPVETLLESIDAQDWKSFELISQNQSFGRAERERY